jgi:hypothetical protein
MPPRSALPSSSQVAAPIPSSQMAETPLPEKKLKKYRPVKPLPYELRDIINVYLEEQLCEILPQYRLHENSLTFPSLTSSSIALQHTHRRHRWHCRWTNSTNLRSISSSTGTHSHSGCTSSMDKSSDRTGECENRQRCTIPPQTRQLHCRWC